MLYTGVLSLAALTLSWVWVGRLRLWAQRHQIIDVPNERSSHARPIPSGGGLAIAVISIVGLMAYWLFNPIWPWPKLLAYMAGAGLVSIVSWLDGLQTLSNRIRFAAHSLAAIMAIFGFGCWDIVSVPFFGQLDLGLVGLPLTFLWIVGLTNAYNFMDGIDGIAGVQAVVAGFGWALLGHIEELPFVGFWGALLAAASLGFLFHNWPPARIFMGDIGSAFLGYSFACLAVIGSQADPIMCLAGVLLVWPFVFDTVFTFFRRLKNGEDVFTAHRSHLYQRLVISGLSHRTVTLLYGGLDVLGMVLALLIVKKMPWADLTVVIVVPVACFGLWALTVMQEKNASDVREVARGVEWKKN